MTATRCARPHEHAATGSCDCCAGASIRTPRSVANPPGLSALRSRVGTHADFFASMIARLADPAPLLPIRDRETDVPAEWGGGYPLDRLRARRLDDPAVALMDAWAVVADILAFYQERIANEGYLPTAVEERSIHEIARLVGYRPRPGVAAELYLALGLEKGAEAVVERGLPARSVPAPGQAAETFETIEDLAARGEWSAMKPLRARLQSFDPQQILADERAVYLRGITTNLKPNDPLVLVFDDRGGELWRVKAIAPDPLAQTTAVRVELWVPLPDAVSTAFDRAALVRAVDAYLAKPDLGFVRSSSLLAIFDAADEVLLRVERVAVPLPTQEELDGAVSRLKGLRDFLAEGECPPLDELVDKLKGVTPSSQGKVTEGRRKYAEFHVDLPGEGKRDDALAAYLLIANGVDSALRGEVREGKPFLGVQGAIDASTPLGQAQLAAIGQEARSRLRDAQRLAQIAGFAPLARRSAELAVEVAPLADLPPGGSIDLPALRIKLKEKVKAAPAFVGIDKSLTGLRDEISGDGPPAATADLQSIRRALTGLAFGFSLAAEPRARLFTLRRQLNDALIAGLKGAEAALDTAVFAAFIDPKEAPSTRVVQRIREDYARQVLRITQVDVEVDRLLNENPPKSLEDFGKLLGASGRNAVTGNPGELEDAFGVAFLIRASIRARVAARLLELWRREAVVFDDGAFPRIAPWYARIVSDLERYSSFLPLTQARADALATALAGSTLEALKGPFAASPVGDAEEELYRKLLTKSPPPAQPPTVPSRTLGELFGDGRSDPSTQLFQALHPRLEGRVYRTLARTDLGRSAQAVQPRVEAPRVTTIPFGASAPLQAVTADAVPNKPPVVFSREWPLASALLDVQVTLEGSDPLAAFVVCGLPGAIVSTRLTASETTLDVPGLGKIVWVSKDPTSFTLTLDFSGPKYILSATPVTAGSDNKLVFTLDGDIKRPDGKPVVLGELISDEGKSLTPELPGGDLKIVRSGVGPDTLEISGTLAVTPGAAHRRNLALDTPYDKIAPGSHVAILRVGGAGVGAEPQILRVEAAETIAMAAYGISGKVTRLRLDGEWLGPDDTTLASLRNTTVFAQGEALDLAEEPYDADVSGVQIELDGIHDGLEPGRVLIVEGERTDLPGTRGVAAAEVVRVAASRQGVEAGVRRQSARPHTILTLADPLTYSYRRDTVTIRGNVARATHGETRREVLGSGDASSPLQSFALKQAPLTFVLDEASPSGVSSTLEVRVNDVRWAEVPRVVDAGPGRRAYVTRLNEEGQATVQFGDGVRGARPPSGLENLRAVYRRGLGRGGNVDARQVSQLVSRPLGVNDVINPLPARGGADREPIDQARRNVPNGLRALDRLVSVADYEDFARGFAGIAKASARRVELGVPRVHLTVAGLEDIDLGNSPLLATLGDALKRFGDPELPFVVAARRLMLVVVEAEVVVHPDYLWRDVEPVIRARLLDRFGFERRSLGEPLYASEIQWEIHGVDGVASSRLTAIGTVPEREGGQELTPRAIADRIQAITAGSESRARRAAEPLPGWRADSLNRAVREAFPGFELGLSEFLRRIERAGAGSKPDPFAKIPVPLACLEGGALVPASIAYLSAKVDSALVLREVKADP